MSQNLHDPNSLNRQGNDVGTQYRSVIFHHSSEQREIAETLLVDLDAQALWPAPIVTDVLPAPHFYPPEDYHQHYFSKNPDQPYCQVIVAPKLAKVRQRFANWIKSDL